LKREKREERQVSLNLTTAYRDERLLLIIIIGISMFPITSDCAIIRSFFERRTRANDTPQSANAAKLRRTRVTFRSRLSGVISLGV
jgi:hypothetical protein